nr:hypothetical protein [uncultured Acinetobacter sp.]
MNSHKKVVINRYSDEFVECEKKDSIRKRNIAELYSVELSDKKSSRKAISTVTNDIARSKYAGYDL